MWAIAHFLRYGSDWSPPLTTYRVTNRRYAWAEKQWREEIEKGNFTNPEAKIRALKNDSTLRVMCVYQLAAEGPKGFKSTVDKLLPGKPTMVLPRRAAAPAADEASRADAIQFAALERKVNELDRRLAALESDRSGRQRVTAEGVPPMSNMPADTNQKLPSTTTTARQRM
ncbi:unnamed protein product [Vitrella brassicaformis CCMP3155]|uniref:Uncharacterized protein n=1 Tax=Vitrella brassicaformis (strain CCMP3155) TaxID=1169540 RepID=A0A0G4EED4_VITBC|nr:unnamed protein product [Vitrella brassicaformis CCMP3155]|eukprot:CEL93717.1 unnamed protein product [Vitrella brassicaformis CCMP3155]